LAGNIGLNGIYSEIHYDYSEINGDIRGVTAKLTVWGYFVRIAPPAYQMVGRLIITVIIYALPHACTSAAAALRFAYIYYKKTPPFRVRLPVLVHVSGTVWDYSQC